MSNQIIVQNVNYGASFDDIRNHFSKAGHVKDVLIALDSNGNSRGIAFVSYDTNKEAHEAVSMFSNTTFQGRKMYVSINENYQNTKENEKPPEPKHIHSDHKHGYRPDKSTAEYNISIFQETAEVIEQGHYNDIEGNYHDISNKVRSSISETVTYPEDFSIEQNLTEKLALRKSYGQNEKSIIFSRIEVTHESTFQAALRCKKETKEVCLLNFANGFVPGGGVLRGCLAQEETLCRQSNLYYCIKDQNEMYDYNKSRNSQYCSHYMIYSPNVVFFRDDDYDFLYPRRVSVITSPAVNCAKLDKSKLDGVYRCMKNRCRRILQLGMYTNNRVLILGAFGCGAFDNKPEDISRIFKELIIDEYYGMFFSKIVFAIKGSSGKSLHNFDVFYRRFKT